MAESEKFSVSALVKDGWLYKDFPRVRPAVWALIKEGLGDGNFHLLSEASYGSAEVIEWQRGQLVISPAGREAMSEFYRANKGRFDAAVAEDAGLPRSDVIGAEAHP